MKKKIILIISIFFVLTINAQDLAKIKNQNMFFLFFENNNLMKMADISRMINEKKYIRYNYYYFRKNDSREKFEFSFNYSKYPTYDDEHNDINAAMVFRLDKSFLRKNKDILITREFMEHIGGKAIISLLAGINKHVFLIDKSEIKNGKILLREVRFDFPEEM